jgi:hypothetical protein
MPMDSSIGNNQGLPPFQKHRHRDHDGRILMSMAVNWIELAQKMAQAARAGVAIERKRLQEILAERQRKQQPQSSSPSR